MNTAAGFWNTFLHTTQALHPTIKSASKLCNRQIGSFYKHFLSKYISKQECRIKTKTDDQTESTSRKESPCMPGIAVPPWPWRMSIGKCLGLSEGPSGCESELYTTPPSAEKSHFHWQTKIQCIIISIKPRTYKSEKSQLPCFFKVQQQN